ncbi:MAG: hypothetical protein IJ671_06985 [Succinivibrio sp.]|nr:hypothetical protein [Succinivibrio sp.]
MKNCCRNIIICSLIFSMLTACQSANEKCSLSAGQNQTVQTCSDSATEETEWEKYQKQQGAGKTIADAIKFTFGIAFYIAAVVLHANQ